MNRGYTQQEAEAVSLSAASVSHGYLLPANAQSPVCATKPATATAAMLERAQLQSRELYTLMERLADLRTRLFGPEPESAEKTGRPPVSGMIGEIMAVLDHNDAVLRTCLSVASDLERLG